MRPHLLAQVLAAGRVVVGLTLVAAPSVITRRWVGPEEGGRPGARVMGMGLGARDLVMGAGTLAALRTGEGLTPWLVGGVAADALDLTATLRSAGGLPKAPAAGAAAIAGTAAAVGVYLLRQDL